MLGEDIFRDYYIYANQKDWNFVVCGETLKFNVMQNKIMLQKKKYFFLVKTVMIINKLV